MSDSDFSLFLNLIFDLSQPHPQPTHQNDAIFIFILHFHFDGLSAILCTLNKFNINRSVN